MTDTYKNYGELKVHEEIEKDYKISISNVGSQTTIIAPHGGKIEPRTSDIAKHIATEKYNYYCFEGIIKNNNGSLHITSHDFDEPSALQLLSKSDVVVAIHACIAQPPFKPTQIGFHRRLDIGVGHHGVEPLVFAHLR